METRKSQPCPLLIFTDFKQSGGGKITTLLKNVHKPYNAQEQKKERNKENQQVDKLTN